jgi:hypothetical protein
MSALGQSRRFDLRPTTSGLPRSTDIIRSLRLVRFVPIPEVGELPGAFQNRDHRDSLVLQGGLAMKLARRQFLRQADRPCPKSAKTGSRQAI